LRLGSGPEALSPRSMMAPGETVLAGGRRSGAGCFIPQRKARNLGREDKVGWLGMGVWVTLVVSVCKRWVEKDLAG